MGRPRFDPRRHQFSGPRTNDRIRVPEVRVIGPEGEMLGILATHEAKRLAREKSLDLVEVNPKAQPPVCKVMDFGKYKYEEKKKQADARRRQVQVELKEVKLRPKTDDHDLEVKIRHARRFLEDGNKVKVTCRFRGREITHPETAERQLDYVVEQCEDIALLETSPRMEGRTMICIISPKHEIRARVAAQAAAAASSKEMGSPQEIDDSEEEGSEEEHSGDEQEEAATGE